MALSSFVEAEKLCPSANVVHATAQQRSFTFERIAQSYDQAHRRCPQMRAIRDVPVAASLLAREPSTAKWFRDDIPAFEMAWRTDHYEN